MEHLSDKEIQHYLGTYKVQFKLIKGVSYNQGSIHAEIIPFIYPFTTEDSSYVNATQINLYISQLSYILMAKSISDEKFELLSSLVNPDQFNKKMHERNLFFGSMTIKMKRVMKKQLPIHANMKILSVRKIAGKIFCDVEFDLGKGSCSGNVLISI